MEGCFRAISTKYDAASVSGLGQVILSKVHADLLKCYILTSYTLQHLNRCTNGSFGACAVKACNSVLYFLRVNMRVRSIIWGSLKDVQDSQSYLQYRLPRKMWPTNVIYTTTMFVNHSQGFQPFIQDPFSLTCGHTLIDYTQKFSFFTKTNFDLDLDLIFYSHYLSLTIILLF